MKRSWFSIIALLIVLSMLLAACGGTEAPEATEAPADVEPTEATDVEPTEAPPVTTFPVPPGGYLEKAVAGEYDGTTVVNRQFLRAAHERNMSVHVWTVNDADQMRRLIDMGVDGIMTDFPQVLIEILGNN